MYTVLFYTYKFLVLKTFVYFFSGPMPVETENKRLIIQLEEQLLIIKNLRQIVIKMLSNQAISTTFHVHLLKVKNLTAKIYCHHY